MNLLDLFTTYGETVTFKVVLFSLVLAFALTQAIGAVYVWTFRGMSYSRSFVQAVALGSVIAAMLMLAINNSIAAGLGIAGSLAIIRFRTAMRDPRDMVFVFASMGAGIACGLRAYSVAMAGSTLFCLGAIALTWTEFGSQRQFDGLLRFRVAVTGVETPELDRILRDHTRSFVLVTLRDVAQGAAMEHAYQVRLGSPKARVPLVAALEALPDVEGVSLMLQEPTVDI